VVNVAAKNGGYAVNTTREQPKSGIQRRNKNNPQENARESQRLLLTWLADYPNLYGKIKKYIMPEDFTEELYSLVAKRIFEEIETGTLNPASIINMFEDEKEQSEAASLFTTNIPDLESKQEKEKAFHDILVRVKKNSYDYYSAKAGVDISALNKVIEGKKSLEELGKLHISLD
jgi:DNA primase